MDFIDYMLGNPEVCTVMALFVAVVAGLVGFFVDFLVKK